VPLPPTAVVLPNANFGGVAPELEALTGVVLPKRPVLVEEGYVEVPNIILPEKGGLLLPNRLEPVEAASVEVAEELGAPNTMPVEGGLLVLDGLAVVPPNRPELDDLAVVPPNRPELAKLGPPEGLVDELCNGLSPSSLNLNNPVPLALGSLTVIAVAA
jgi:hypothetical protein